MLLLLLPSHLSFVYSRFTLTNRYHFRIADTIRPAGIRSWSSRASRPFIADYEQPKSRLSKPRQIINVERVNIASDCARPANQCELRPASSPFRPVLLDRFEKSLEVVGT